MMTLGRRVTPLFLTIALFANMVMFTQFAPMRAQAAPPAHHKNFIQRHPLLTGIAAGIATHHALKVSAKRKKARGQKLNWAERHPSVTGFGVGAATHHIIKKTTH